MSHGQFIFFTPNRGNEEHLKEELKSKFKDLKLSFSRPGFVTFKNHGEPFSLEELSDLHFAFSRTHGLCLGPVDKDNINSEIESYLNDYSISSYIKHEWSRDGKKSYSDNNETSNFVFNIIEVDRNKLWIGLHLSGKNSNLSPGGFPKVEVPEQSPSRDYAKIAEIVESYSLDIKVDDSILDIGCAPGGATFYFLNKGNKVVGIDPGEMDEVCKLNKNFKHLQSPVQKITKRDIKVPIDWIVMDLNLQAGLSLKEGIRMAKEYPNLKGLAYTVKMPTTDLCARIEEFRQKFLPLKFKNLIISQVPSHKKEFAVIAFN